MKKPDKLPNLINRLVEIEPTDSPLISCFVDLEQPRADYFTEVEAQAELAGKRLSGVRRRDFEDALEEIRDYLSRPFDAETKSVVIYARWGDRPLVLPAKFEVPMETMFIVDGLPHIYPLIELKDVYQRFVTVVTTETEARILETTFGAVTQGILARRPELRRRIVQEWTREHYANHKRERNQQFLRAKIDIIDRLMGKKGTSYLVLAGSPKMVNRLTKALPDRLKRRLVSTRISPKQKAIEPLVWESVLLVAAAEQLESQNRVERLEKAVLAGWLGVGGYEATAEALRGGYADVLVIDQDLNDIEMREELVRLARNNGVEIETVKRSAILKRLSGVGCLLRQNPDSKVRSGREAA